MIRVEGNYEHSLLNEQAQLSEMYQRILARGAMPNKRFRGLDSGDGDQGFELRISGALDPWEVDYQEIISLLDRVQPKNLRLLIESPGGYVSDGVALYHDLRRRADSGMNLTTEVMGICASAATLPLVAADDREMREGSLVMVHRVWGFFLQMGNAAELRDFAEKQIAAMDKMDEMLAIIYAGRTGMPQEAAIEMMDAETWMNAEDAAGSNFATMVLPVAAGGDGDMDGEADAKAQSHAAQIMCELSMTM